MAIDFNKPVETLNGAKVEIKITDGRGPYPVKGYIAANDGLSGWTLDGISSMGLELHNLRNGPNRRSVFMSLYASKDRLLCSALDPSWKASTFFQYSSLEEAKAYNTDKSGKLVADIVEVCLEDDVIVGIKHHKKD